MAGAAGCFFARVFFGATPVIHRSFAIIAIILSAGYAPVNQRPRGRQDHKHFRCTSEIHSIG
jgi:hypothetical protein